jgi:hypothetical protein
MKLHTFGIAVIGLAILGFFAYEYAFAPIELDTARDTQPSVPEQETLLNTFTDPVRGFTVQYPVDFTAHTDYIYEVHQQNKQTVTIGGVKFVVPSFVSDTTNLSNDTYISVEEIPMQAVCSATQFLNNETTANSISDGGKMYSLASQSDAAAGNRYEEVVYAFPTPDACMGVRYFIHYSVLEKYPEGTKKAFEKESLIAQFDAIRRSLTIK